MKTILSFILLLLITSFISQRKTKVIFFGDSITQAGVQPGGYIVRIDSMCRKEGLGNKYEFTGAGISGNKVYDLFLRLEEDVLIKNPDIVVTYIGANDVWHKSTSGTGKDADKFEKFYQAMIDKMKANNIKLILCTPAVIGEKMDFSNQQDGDMNQYSNIIRQLAAKNDLQLVDLRKSFLEFNLKNNPENKERGILTTDRVHLNAKGNQLVADEIWKLIKN
ncbi:MAG TPA: GDSL-type esterase/lipase family protein [Chitinophagaceae bacterium]|nr:GDSL-type esterase/lipase family protein [Chitinophagaceae bacterium]